MVIRGKRIISGILSLGLVLSCVSCGREAETTAAEIPELLEPVGVAQSYETVARRTLFDAQVYAATVCPAVTEYSPESSLTFEEYDAFPGETVKKGSRLLHGNTESVDKSIEQLEETIADMDESYQEYCTEILEKIAESRAAKQYNGEIVERIESYRPEQYVTVTDGETGEETKELNPEYTQWQAAYTGDYAKYSSLYYNASQSLLEQEEAYKERTELYELDRAYNVRQLEYLRQDKRELTATATAGGVVANVQFLTKGDWVSKDQQTIAVCDPEKKELRCDYISKGTVTRAEDVYALIDGKRYEVEYQALDAEEYQRLKEQNGTVYSTFYLQEGAEEITQGSYAVIVIVKKAVRDVLTVPKDAVNKDDTSSRVYILGEDGEAEAVTVKTGETDGIYTEIVSGLNEGDKVLTESAVTAAEGSTAVLAKGSVGYEFTANGYLYYPSSEWVTNDITYGTVYYVERLVKQYQQVKKGEVLARVRVLADEVGLERNERKLQREQERLADLKAEKDENNEKTIAAKEEYIQELEELIAEMKEDFAVTEIVSPINGIITEFADYETEQLVSAGDKLFQVSDETRSYIIIEDTNHQLSYGNEAVITYTGEDGQEKTAHGEVVTLNSMAVSPEFETEVALLQVSPEDIGGMAGSSQGYEGWWNRSRFKISITIRSMQDVLLVPKKAVKEKNGCTYVKVKREDGGIVYQSFIAGGSDVSNYWVAEGLTEGMEICLD